MPAETTPNPALSNPPSQVLRRTVVPAGPAGTRGTAATRWYRAGLAALAAVLLLLAGLVAAPAGAAPAAPTAVAARSYSKATVAKHNKASDCWSIVDGKVYNLTKWISKHPGGRARIVRMCGKDASRAFHSQHSGGGKAGAALRRYYLGKVR